jgi:hypothetical protein
MYAKSAAFVVHQTPNRIRIKIPERQGQHAYFAALQRTIGEYPDVIAVNVSPLVASVVIHCRDGFEINSLRHPFLDLELPPASSPPLATLEGRQLVHPGGMHGFSENSIGVNAVLLKLFVATAMGQLGAQIVEWIIGAFVQTLVCALNQNAVDRRSATAHSPLLLAAAE